MEQEKINIVKKTYTYLPKNEKTISFPKDTTALLVIDPVNDFLSEGGAGYDLTKVTLKMNDVVTNLRRVIQASRLAAIPVIFGPMAYIEEDYADEQLQRRSGINRFMFENKMFLAGSWGADFHPELQPQENDIVLLPHKGCDVFQTDLPEHLERLNITHLVIAGMSANLCCESTGRHATEKGFDVTFLADAIGATTVPEYEASIHLNYPLISNAVIKTDNFLAALAGLNLQNIRVKQGDTVYGSDNGEIGKVEKVFDGTDGTDPYFLVPSGLIFKTDTFIPSDAVVKRIGTDVFINIPKLILATMPWKSPPGVTEKKDKMGPRAGDVKKLYRTYEPFVPF